MRDFTKPLPEIQEDMHIHSVFSDGKNTLAENAAAAYLLGLRRVCMTEHVRKNTTWLSDFTRTVTKLKDMYRGRMDIYAGVEAKICNEVGDLDLPKDVSGIDYILVADHQFPLGNRFVSPDDVICMLQAGTIDPEDVARSLIASTIAVMERHDRLILTHLFSLLPKVGLTEACIADEQLEYLAQRAAATKTQVEINERWQCPSIRVVDVLLQYGVDVVFGSDAHSKEAVGRYAYLYKVHAFIINHRIASPVLVPS